MNKSKLKPIPNVIPRGIYLLPSLMTLGNIFCGFYSMITVITHFRNPDPSAFFVRAALLLIAAALLDSVDGRIARMTNSTSAFGAQLDSIADVISFGIAPGILAFCWALKDFHRSGWIPAFLFLGCGAIRLARFNVLEEDKEFKSVRYFIGLPIPAAAACVASMVLISPKIESRMVSIIVLGIVYALSFLMVSKFRFRSFKDVDWKQKRPLGTLFFIVILLIVLLHEPGTMLFILSFLYAISGVIAYFLPETMLMFFRKMDQAFLGVKILDDEDSPEAIQTLEDSSESQHE